MLLVWLDLVWVQIEQLIKVYIRSSNITTVLTIHTSASLVALIWLRLIKVTEEIIKVSSLLLLL